MTAIAVSVRRRALPAVALALAMTTPAAAALDAAKIGAQAQAVLDGYVTVSEGKLKPQGKVVAERDGDAVVVTTPVLLFEDPATRIEVPGALLRLRETGADEVAFSVTLPDRITGTGGGPRKDTLLLTIGGQKIEGVFLPSLLTFGSLDARLDAIRAETGDGSVHLGSLAVKGANVEAAPGRWRSDAAMSLGDLRVTGPDNAVLFRVGNIQQAWRLENFDLASFAELQKRLSGGNLFLPMQPGDEASAQAAQEFMQRLPELLDGASGGLSFAVTDLQTSAPEQPPFSLSSASFDVGLAPDEAFYGLALALTVDRPQVDPAAAPVPPELMPRRALADAGLRRLPLAPLWATIAAPIQQAMQLEMAGKMTPEAEAAINEQMELMPMAFMGLAAEAGSFAEIRSIELEVGPARLSARGVGPLVPGLPEPPLRVEAAIEGLEDLAAEVQKLDPALRDQVMPFLVMLRGMGKATSQNSRIVHTFLIEQSPAGAITVNGVSLEKMAPQQ